MQEPVERGETVNGDVASDGSPRRSIVSETQVGKTIRPVRSFKNALNAAVNCNANQYVSYDNAVLWVRNTILN